MTLPLASYGSRAAALLEELFATDPRVRALLAPHAHAGREPVLAVDGRADGDEGIRVIVHVLLAVPLGPVRAEVARLARAHLRARLPELVEHGIAVDLVDADERA